uniref:Uncharacterized protein n=1 Tax=Castor canadensis TaxID=51338 RepID=A0A8C0W1B8_CASCN
MASWYVQNCCAFRHFCAILDKDLKVNCHQMPSVPVGSQLAERILSGNNTRKPLARRQLNLLK